MTRRFTDRAGFRWTVVQHHTPNGGRVRSGQCLLVFDRPGARVEMVSDKPMVKLSDADMGTLLDAGISAE